VCDFGNYSPSRVKVMRHASKSISNNIVRRLSINDRWSSIGDIIGVTANDLPLLMFCAGMPADTALSQSLPRIRMHADSYACARDPA
jgi:hypothetical protein